MNVIFECPTLLRNCLLSHEPPRQLTKNRILCFKFSLNPLRFSFARETDPAKSLKIWKTSILEWWTWPKQQFCCFFLFNCKSYHSRIEVLQKCSFVFLFQTSNIFRALLNRQTRKQFTGAWNQNLLNK